MMARKISLFGRVRNRRQVHPFFSLNGLRGNPKGPGQRAAISSYVFLVYCEEIQYVELSVSISAGLLWWPLLLLEGLLYKSTVQKKDTTVLLSSTPRLKQDGGENPRKDQKIKKYKTGKVWPQTQKVERIKTIGGRRKSKKNPSQRKPLVGR